MKTNILIAIRNILKRPLLNIIKVVGLSLALCGIVFIVLFLKNELSYDRFHRKSDRIYRFTYTSPLFFNGNHFARVANASDIPDFCKNTPGIVNYVRLSPAWGGIKYNEQYIKVEQAFICDSTFLDVFDLDLLTGNPNTILKSPGSLIVSESFAKRVFGNTNPVGQLLNLPTEHYNDKHTDFVVKGVMADFPQNSHLHPEILFTTNNQKVFEFWAFTYLLLDKNANPDIVESEFKRYKAKLQGKALDEIDQEAHLQKITDIHLHSNKLREIEANSNIYIIYVFIVAAIILLLISLSNYANLIIGMSVFYNKFQIINKILGASKRVNLRYFITEGLLVSFSTIIMAVLIIIPFNIVIKQYYSMELLPGNIELVLILFLLFVILILIVGILPVVKQTITKIRLNSSSDIALLSSVKKTGGGLMILQYSFSIILIISVIVIARQTNFLLENSLGNQSDNIIYIESAQGKFQIFREELLRHNSINSVSAMFTKFGGESNDMFPFKLEGYQMEEKNNRKERIGVFPCDYSFPSFFNLQFLSGNDFSNKIEDNDGSGEYIINEAALKRLGYSNPFDIIGKNFQVNSIVPEVKIPKGKIIGVVKDFHLSTMKKKVVPLVMFKMKETWISSNVVSFKPEMQNQAIDAIKAVWAEIYPEHTLHYEKVGNMYENVYKTELLQAKLLSVFTFIAIFICSMGLLGLTLLSTQQKTKEIGIRKVNGAKIYEILTMLNSNFVKWVAIAFIISCPIAWYAMKRWLESFAYKTELSWWIYIIAGIFTLITALLTVSWQSLRAARMNPVEALRYE